MQHRKTKIHQVSSRCLFDSPAEIRGSCFQKARGFRSAVQKKLILFFFCLFLLHNFHAEPRSAGLDGYQSSPEALITSAPSFHLCNPRAQSLVCLVMWRDEEIDQGLISTEGLIARAPSPSLLSTAVLEAASNAITNCLVPIRAHGEGGSGEGGCIRRCALRHLCALGISVAKMNRAAQSGRTWN